MSKYSVKLTSQTGPMHITPSNHIHTTPILSTRYYNPLPTHSSTLCQKTTMNNQPNSPIPTRLSTPSNLWSTTPIKNRPLSPTFDEKILPSHWSSNTCQVIKKTMEDLLKLKRILQTAIQSLKYSLPALHLPREQTNKLIKVLMMAAEQFKNVQDSACHFTKYLKKEDRYVIKALITSEPLTKSLTKLLTSPAYLEYVLHNQKNDD